MAYYTPDRKQALELNHVQASGPGTEASGKAASDVPTSAAHFASALRLNQVEAGM